MIIKAAMNNYKVYYHELKSDGRKYFGITSQKIQHRWRGDGSGYKTSVHFYRAIQKYGWDNFFHFVIADGLSRDEAEKMEKEMIAKYDTTNADKGFNIAEGGKSNSGFHHSQEARAKISATMKGKPANNKGKPRSKDAIEKARMSNIGKKRSAAFCKLTSEKAKKPVRCIETGQIYASMTDAAEAFGNNSHIGDACNGKRKKAAGYHWEYLQGGD